MITNFKRTTKEIESKTEKRLERAKENIYFLQKDIKEYKEEIKKYPETKKIMKERIKETEKEIEIWTIKTETIEDLLIEIRTIISNNSEGF